MKKKIIILGSTGSIGKSLINIVKKNKKNFDIILLTANKNYKELYKQSKLLNVKNLIITDPKGFNFLKNKNKKVNIYNNYNNLDKIIKKKVDYTMSSITGLDGLEPTLNIINKTKTIAIANKESIICAWDLIKKKLTKHKTEFIPVDSEHFSIWSLIRNQKKDNINKIYITASGGPFINLPNKKFDKIKLSDALKHPNWRMGKKITIDSATLMNKVFEVIEAKNIFNINYNKISILTHPKSYIHAIVKFENGLTKILAHDPDMKIPIYNSLYDGEEKNLNSKSINLDILNHLNLKKVNLKKFPLVKILDNLPSYSSMYETALITINDYLVSKFLAKEINFNKLIKSIKKIANLKEFQKYKRIKPKNAADIYRLRKYVSSKMNSFSI
ncbi:1-deoxy-D-xylulose-5-phosphate reductoisomerase [Candidatus Pelagibacter sp.]|nr:1-deoxy-D-xylulose-5-phosphate reductoisomerase [Candidatus Pelagibacter sp.]